MILVIDLLINLFYTSLYSTVTVLLILFLRRLLGPKLWYEGRIILWLLAVIVMLVPANPNFKTSYFRNDTPFPPFEFIFDQYRIPDESYEDYYIPNGEYDFHLRIWNGSGYDVYTWNGRIVTAVLFAIWAIGIAILLLWQVLSYIRLIRKLKSFSHSQDTYVQSLVSRDKLYWGMNKEIPVIIAREKMIKEIRCPSAVGIRKPMIILPAEQWQNLSDNEKQAVITHELIHIKFHDNLYNLLLLFLQAIHWFNPILWLGLKYLRQDMEALRDSYIIRHLSKADTQSYAGAILNIACMNQRKYRITPHSGMFCTSGVGLRLHLITATKKKSLSIRILQVSLIAIISFAILWMIFDRTGLYILGFRDILK